MKEGSCCPIMGECRRRPIGAPRIAICTLCPCHPFMEQLTKLTTLNDQGQEEESS